MNLGYYKIMTSIKHIIKSILGAFIGIQNEEHAKKDFEQGSLHYYVIGGIIGVLVLIILIYGAVRWVMS
jgi:hypothetical protein